MNSLRIPLALISLALLTGAAKCKSEEQIQKSCEGVMCTMMFASVTPQVQDASGAPVALDSTRISSAQLGISVAGKPGLNGSGYTIIDDNQVKQLAQRSGTVTFTGYKGGREVVREDFVVGADCCHVSKVSGPEIITVK